MKNIKNFIKENLSTYDLTKKQKPASGIWTGYTVKTKVGTGVVQDAVLSSAGRYILKVKINNKIVDIDSKDGSNIK